MVRRAVIALAAIAAVAGCGETNPRLIPADRSEALLASVDRIEEACANGDTREAAQAVSEAKLQVNELPRRVDDQLPQNLLDWLDRVDRRGGHDCAGEATALCCRNGRSVGPVYQVPPAVDVIRVTRRPS